MIVGLGIDIIEIKKLHDALDRNGNRLKNRTFTKTEIRYCEKHTNKYQHYAARFAAKEAVFKALGTGWSQGVGWHDVDVCNLPTGNPQLLLSGKAYSIATKLGATKFWISLSHSDQYAVAWVILES